jgi:hypothetical protein
MSNYYSNGDGSSQHYSDYESPWVKGYSEEGHEYYYNNITQESQWECPPELLQYDEQYDESATYEYNNNASQSYSDLDVSNDNDFSGYDAGVAVGYGNNDSEDVMRRIEMENQVVSRYAISDDSDDVPRAQKGGGGLNYSNQDIGLSHERARIALENQVVSQYAISDDSDMDPEPEPSAAGGFHNQHQHQPQYHDQHQDLHQYQFQPQQQHSQQGQQQSRYGQEQQLRYPTEGQYRHQEQQYGREQYHQYQQQPQQQLHVAGPTTLTPVSGLSSATSSTFTFSPQPRNIPGAGQGKKVNRKAAYLQSVHAQLQQDR